MTHGATDLPEAEQGLPPCGIALSDVLGPNARTVGRLRGPQPVRCEICQWRGRRLKTQKRAVPGLRFARGVRMKMIYTEAMCRADALREEAAGDPDCSAGCNGCENCTDYSAALNDARNNELKAAQELDELREQLSCVRQALPEQWRDSLPSVAVATMAAEADELRAALRELVALADMKARLENLHAMGHGTDWDGYHKRNPAAWAAARSLTLGPNVEVQRRP